MIYFILFVPFLYLVVISILETRKELKIRNDLFYPKESTEKIVKDFFQEIFPDYYIASPANLIGGATLFRALEQISHKSAEVFVSSREITIIFSGNLFILEGNKKTTIPLISKLKKIINENRELFFRDENLEQKKTLDNKPVGLEFKYKKAFRENYNLVASQSKNIIVNMSFRKGEDPPIKELERVMFLLEGAENLEAS